MQSNDILSGNHGLKDADNISSGGTAQSVGGRFNFGRLFGGLVSQPVSLKFSTCVKIGAHMTAVSEPSRENSLYGTTQGQNQTFMNGFKFKLGKTTATPGVGGGSVEVSHANDLPRVAQKAQIGDPRNDENLAVAQIHLMWLKFHNQIAQRLFEKTPGASPALIFEQARDLVTRHYQHVILHDFLPRFLDANVFEDVVVNRNRKIMHHMPGEDAFMPLEFSTAAYRMGHSMVREIYDWNLNFGSPGNIFEPPTNFAQLFVFSGTSGNLGGAPTLPSNWLPDWRRLFDLSNFEFPHLERSELGELNLAKKIDPFIAQALGNLPGGEGRLFPSGNLATLNLARGSLRGMPSGQDVAQAISGIRKMSAAQMRRVLTPGFEQDMEMFGLLERTPLWLYILIEAASVGDGDRLGPLGSQIVAETFLTLVLTSRTTILSQNGVWTPSDAMADIGATSPLLGVANILAWLDAEEPFVDPLQDERTRSMG